MNNYNDIPIFPLKSIILPGGQFPLRIFERRYLDMIKDSLKTNSGFVIALTKRDADYISSVHDYACYVEIVDWSQLDGGLLGITVEGKSLVTLSNYKLDETNLLRGDAQQIKSSIDHLIPQKYQILSKFYRKIYPEIKAYIFHNKSKYNDANWIGFRLIECLPIEISDKADLIATNEPLDRLEKILHIVKRIYPKELDLLD
jgi:Lon protease-like protein